MSNVQRRMSNGLVKRPTDQTIGSLGGLVKFIRHSTLDIRHLDYGRNDSTKDTRDTYNRPGAFPLCNEDPPSWPFYF
jgi:hypothetical protein